MPRLTRLDFRGAFHYVQISGCEDRTIFFDANDLQRTPEYRDQVALLRKFSLLLSAVVDECNMPLHGYCVEPNCCRLLLERFGVPLEYFMRRFCGQYSKHVHHLTGWAASHVFRGRYAAKVVAPEYLPHAVRQIHRSPVLNGLAPRPVDYPFSSDRAYRGKTPLLPLRTTRIMAALQLRGYIGLGGYDEFMHRTDSPFVADLLARGSPLDGRVIGGKPFVQHARYKAAHSPAPPSREDLTAKIGDLLGIAPTDIQSSTHRGALGRSLVAWHGLQSGAATLTEMGRWFSVTGATLGQGIRHHRKMSPHLFDTTLLFDDVD